MPKKAPSPSSQPLTCTRRSLLQGAASLAGLTGLGALSGCSSPPPPARPAAAAPPPRAAQPVPALPTQPPLAAIDLSAADWALLNRVTWGVDQSGALALRQHARRDYLQSQLYPARDTLLPIEAQSQIDALNRRPAPLLEQTQAFEQRRRDNDAIADVEAKKAAQQSYQQDLSTLAQATAHRQLLLALYSPHQLREQLSWFWFNHFNVYQYKANLRLWLSDYEDQLRARALGRFRDLLLARVTHAAMLRYLDNEQNAVGRINENLAREVMELHTLGVNGGYTQTDVQEMARVLTGLGVNLTDKTPNIKPALQGLYVRQGLTEFNPARHDMGDKVVLGELVAGRGWDEIMDQLTRLARHPATARRICQRLAVFFVADEPDRALLERMTQAYLSSDGHIAVTLQALFDAPGFSASLGRKFKDPMHFVVSAVRLSYPDAVIRNPQPLLGWLQRLGQPPYNRVTPDGYPMDAAAWASSGQMGTRFEIARIIGSGPAGLFKAPGPDGVEVKAMPQLLDAPVPRAVSALWGERTRAALAAAPTNQERRVLMLSSPEFMMR